MRDKVNYSGGLEPQRQRMLHWYVLRDGSHYASNWRLIQVHDQTRKNALTRGHVSY